MDKEYKEVIDKLHEVALSVNSLVTEMKESRREHDATRTDIHTLQQRVREIELNQRGIMVKVSMAALFVVPILSVIGRLLYDFLVK